MILLKKKSKSLLLPYILWTILTILLYLISQSIPYISSYFQNPDNIIRNWKLIDWFKAFTYHKFSESGNYPLVFQFWFLRDLIILIIISPLIKFICNKIPALVIILVTILSIKNVPIFFINHPSSLFYYVAGYFFATYRISFFNIADRIKIYEYIVLLILCVVFHYCSNGQYSLGFITSVISSLFFLKISYSFISNQRLYTKLEYLSQFSFFLYALHMPFLGTAINKVSQEIIPLHGIMCLLQFIFASLLIIVIGTILSILVSKLFPKLFILLNGGRK